ncbi:J domain-containing protein [soil metagenome]
MAKIAFKDYYQILDVERDADEKTLRAAFRKLARKYHPDVNPGDKTAEDQFKELNEAYEVLSDTGKRQLYDRYGEDWQRYQEAGFTGKEPQQSRQRADFDDFGSWYSGRSGGTRSNQQSTGDAGFSDFFETLFGDQDSNRGSSFTSSRQRSQRGRDLEAPVEINFSESFNGTSRRFDIQTQDVCPTCQGTGFSRNTTCATCDGGGYLPRTRSIEVSIPPGAGPGTRVRVAGQGGAGIGDGPSGDVYLIVTVKPDPRFEREEINLKTIVDVPLFTALIGGEVLVPTPTGQVSLRIPEGTQQGRLFRLRGLGMPGLKSKDRERGDLVAKVNVVLPTTLDQAERDLITQWQSMQAGKT